MAEMKCVLSIAGSDSGAGAGIQSDLKTFHNHGVYGVTVITSITAQNTMGVQKSFELPANIIDAQLKSIFADFKINAVKIGMLLSERVINVISKYLNDSGSCPIIIDPVILSKNKFSLLNEEGIEALKKKLFPLAYLITPNLYEAETLSGIKIRSTKKLETASKIIQSYGCKNVLIKGGHFTDSSGLKKGTDLLYDGKNFSQFPSKIIQTKNTHGIGCVLSSAIASNLALGKNLNESIISAKKYIVKQLIKNVKIGKGTGPVEK